MNEEQLEKLVDAFSVSEVLRTLATICNGKADHLRTNWQDEAAAITWERIARRITNAADYAFANGQ